MDGFPSAFKKLATDLLKGAAAAALEPEKRGFRIRPGQVGAITRTLRAIGHDETREFSSPKGRDDFLWATANYLAPLEHEELIVAIGSRRGSRRAAGACLRRVHRVVGQRDNVPVTPALSALLENELQRDGAEILLVHNHPRHLIKTAIGHVVGWRPLASDADRALAQRVLQGRVAHLLTSARPSSFKWYLVDERQIGEFVLPPFDTLHAWVQRVVASTPVR